MLSINFPLTTVGDYVMHNSDCVQDVSSQIEVDACRVDISQRAIYITLVAGNHTNGLSISVLTRNRAIRNPMNNYTNANMRDFIVRFYSWENLTYSSANGVSYTYLMMDSTNIQSVATTYSVLVSPVIYPFYVSMFPHTRSINEFVPYNRAHYAPFSFDIYLPVTYSTQAAPNYNTLTVYYGANFTTIYTVTRTWDMYYNKPVCYLNNNRVKLCTLSSATNSITMQFLFALAPSVPIHVYVSVLDPRNSEVNGFTYSGLGVAMIRVETQPFGGAVYSVETEPFDAFQTQPFVQTNPYRAISYGTASYAHSVANKLNVVTMQLWFNSGSSIVKGLVFEIPLVDELGVQIFSDPTTAFFSLTDGAPYPCGNNGLSSSGRVKCYLETGDNAKLGAPVRIHMTDFSYSSTMFARLMLFNPDSTKWLSIKVHAYGTSKTKNSVYGTNYLGYYNFMYLFQSSAATYTAAGFQYSNSYFYPELSNRLIMRDSSNFILSRFIPSPGPNINSPTSTVTILEVQLEGAYGYTDNKVCEVTYTQGMTTSDDILFLNVRNDITGVVTRKAYFIKTWQAVDSVWYIQWLKCKHFIKPVTAYYVNT